MAHAHGFAGGRGEWGAIADAGMFESRDAVLYLPR
jgi:hypothetical protein